MMTDHPLLSTDLLENIKKSEEIFPIKTSFDFITRHLFLGQNKAYFIGINGFCRNDILQRIFSDLQNPLFYSDFTSDTLQNYLDSKIGYVQTQLESSWDKIIRFILSGTCLLIIEGFSEGIILDTRNYPTRSIEEPDTEKVTRGAKDGFVETLLFNTNLIRRRIRDPRLVFELTSVGSSSKTDVAISYLRQTVDEDVLLAVRKKLSSFDISTLTMGSKSLEELFIKKSWLHPLPCFLTTERPDVACSYLLEGYLIVIVDNSPSAIVLPCTIFQFTQSPEDYYKTPITGTYFRLLRFFCLIGSLLLMPLFFLFGLYYSILPSDWQLLTTSPPERFHLFFYILVIELGLDIFKYASAHTASAFSSSIGLIGGLIISDIAIELHWLSLEVLFYGAATMLITLSISNLEFGEGIRIYRLFLVLCTGFFKLWGFFIGLFLVFLSILTTPTFAKKSYFWPLYPFEWNALKTLLFRYPTSKAQPPSVWKKK